ncbi:mis18-binding protein 1-like isoform X3 [Syngnathoides biaculeatus]|uniref:mis18-binding protein 1-like isoform X3 n=1 Tax=Syngnathoides biaculeatus TaxID=300417 RepID=UPI002ADDF663|nr:mis18-binding protein 1-like isoform X3 [Syngnathoides biaculeatus]
MDEVGTNSDVAPKVSLKKSLKIPRVLLFRLKGHQQHGSSGERVQPARLRKVKTPYQKRQNEVQPDGRSSVSTRAAAKRQSQRAANSGEKSDKESARPSRGKPKMNVCNTPPLKKSGGKPAVTKFSTVKSGAASDENTMPNQRRPQKLPVQESKKKALNGPQLRRSGRNRTSQFSPVHEKLSAANSLEEEAAAAAAVPSTKRNKHSERRPMQKGGRLEPLMPVKTHAILKQNSSRECTVSPHGVDEGDWAQDELAKLQRAVAMYPLSMPLYWTKVAKMVGTRSAQECHDRDPRVQDFQTPAKSSWKNQNKKAEAPDATDLPVISAGVRTLKRKQQVRRFLEAMPREDTNDAFSATQKDRFEISSMSLSGDQDFIMADPEPTTTASPLFSPVKCLYTSPGMVDSPNRINEDRFVSQLQQRLWKQKQVKGRGPVSAKNCVAAPSVKGTRTQFEKSGNNSLAVWEMFPEKAAASSDSGEEEDFYFSDND